VKPPRIWGGIAYAPQHPAADMHGLVRVVLKAPSKHAAIQRLKRLGIKQWVALQITQSAIEQAAANNLAADDGVLFCELQVAYLRVQNYKASWLMGRSTKTV